MKTIVVFYICPSCSHEMEIEVEPVDPARTWGSPDSWRPAEGGEYQPSECKNCGADVDGDRVFALLEEAVIDQQGDYPEPDDR